jgi:ABC-type Fe2+-enterobactin transport system substrate-binding protein
LKHNVTTTKNSIAAKEQRILDEMNVLQENALYALVDNTTRFDSFVGNGVLGTFKVHR